MWPTEKKKFLALEKFKCLKIWILENASEYRISIKSAIFQTRHDKNSKKRFFIENNYQIFIKCYDLNNFY